MRVLIACEFSGIVRDAFTAAGHYALSCDLLPSETTGPHYQGDVLNLLAACPDWDLMIAFPPCTDLAVSGARWWAEKGEERQETAISFVRALLDAPIPRIALENPIGKLSTAIRRPDQIIQPWHYGDPHTKATCLWLKGVPQLFPTRIVEGKSGFIHHQPPGPERAKNRSRTFPGIAAAMANQWGIPPAKCYRTNWELQFGKWR